ncbi:hypothetical protein AB0M48_38760 [Lentzea sp. NPDC051208]|uniref:hypothetical protein n=1 Tax=Lentzea sp. NPDC051208 TaxID=3154642 RepID=UPI0034170033
MSIVSMYVLVTTTPLVVLIAALSLEHLERVLLGTRARDAVASEVAASELGAPDSSE